MQWPTAQQQVGVGLNTKLHRHCYWIKSEIMNIPIIQHITAESLDLNKMLQPCVLTETTEFTLTMPSNITCPWKSWNKKNDGNKISCTQLQIPPWKIHKSTVYINPQLPRIYCTTSGGLRYSPQTESWKYIASQMNEMEWQISSFSCKSYLH